MHAKPLQSCSTLCNPVDHSSQASLSRAFFKQEYWNGLICPSARDLPDPGIQFASLMSPALAGSFFTTDAS